MGAIGDQQARSDDDSNHLERGPTTTTSPSVVHPPGADRRSKATCWSLPIDKRWPIAVTAGGGGGGRHDEQQRRKTNDRCRDDQKNGSSADAADVDERGRTAGRAASASTATSPDGGGDDADETDWSIDGLNRQASFGRLLLDGNYQISLGGHGVYPSPEQLGLHRWLYGGSAGEPGSTVATAMAQLMMLQDGGMSLLGRAAAGYLGNRNSVGVPLSVGSAFGAAYDDDEDKAALGRSGGGGSGGVIYDRYGAIDLSNRRSTSA